MHEPGRMGLSDFTEMGDLAVDIGGGLAWLLPSTGAMLLVELAGLGPVSFALLTPLGVLRRGELRMLLRRS